MWTGRKHKVGDWNGKPAGARKDGRPEALVKFRGEMGAFEGLLCMRILVSLFVLLKYIITVTNKRTLYCCRNYLWFGLLYNHSIKPRKKTNKQKNKDHLFYIFIFKNATLCLLWNNVWNNNNRLLVWLIVSIFFPLTAYFRSYSSLCYNIVVFQPFSRRVFFFFELHDFNPSVTACKSDFCPQSIFSYLPSYGRLSVLINRNTIMHILTLLRCKVTAKQMYHP